MKDKGRAMTVLVTVHPLRLPQINLHTTLSFKSHHRFLMVVVSHNLFTFLKRRHRTGRETSYRPHYRPQLVLRLTDAHRLLAVPSILDAPHLGQQGSRAPTSSVTLLLVCCSTDMRSSKLSGGRYYFSFSKTITVVSGESVLPYPLETRISSPAEPRALRIKSVNLPSESLRIK